jgi:exodeoxyribonuclease-3
LYAFIFPGCVATSLSYSLQILPADFFLRVVSFNANGLRSAARKGFFRWFTRQRADVLCVQELKAHEHQLAENVFEPRGFHRVCHAAQRPGYSGVALYTRAAPLEVVQGIGVPEFDAEGRYLEAHFGSLTIASAYFPSGSSSPARQEAKFRFLEAFDRRLEVLQRNSRPLVFCGDFNMAHRPIDLKNWRANQDYPGFTPAERAWLDTLFDARNMVDAFRAVNQEPGQYTWWSNRGPAWDNNTGWRIDYQVVSSALRARIRRVAIYKRQRFSDHAPLTVDYDCDLSAGPLDADPDHGATLSNNRIPGTATAAQIRKKLK